MKSGFKKSINVIYWVVIPISLLFAYYLFTEWDSFTSLIGKNPGIYLLLVSVILMGGLCLLFRNLERGIITLISVTISFFIISGLSFYFDLNYNSLILWGVVYAFTLITGILIMRRMHGQKGRVIWISNTGIKTIVLVTLSSGFLFLVYGRSIATDNFGFALTLFAITYLYVANFQMAIYESFFTKRINRGLEQLTFLNIIQTLWTYFILVMGSFTVGIMGGVLFVLFFIDLEKRKTIIHRMIFNFSRFYIWVIPIYPKVVNVPGETFEKPSIIISNHQSLIDTPLMFKLYPKTIILTNDWVYNSPLFGLVSRLGDFYTVSSGIDSIMEKLRNRVKEGYSIIVFPEGTRSASQKIQRFHRGAFYIAEELKLDIVPVIIYGTGEFLKKGEFWGKGHPVTQRIFPRIGIDDVEYGKTYSERAKQIRRFLIEKYNRMIEEK